MRAHIFMSAARSLTDRTEETDTRSVTRHYFAVKILMLSSVADTRHAATRSLYALRHDEEEMRHAATSDVAAANILRLALR